MDEGTPLRSGVCGQDECPAYIVYVILFAVFGFMTAFARLSGQILQLRWASQLPVIEENQENAPTLSPQKPDWQKRKEPFETDATFSLF